ncbi:MAG: lysine--tRNA ligase [Candidatus Desulfofervidaceae bacterium]|nr:lysine--tRNA ligase [Candidatus Desulfofervidaceae bacterium]
MEETLVRQRREKAQKLVEKGVKLYPNDFKPTHRIQEVLNQYGDKDEASLANLNKCFRLAGRIIALRRFGRAAFIHFQDATGKLQAYFKQDVLGKEQYEIFKLLDVGDIIGMEGQLFRTKTGELTLMVKWFKLLTKSLHPLPEKYHGLKDVELRYRQRYLDLIVNPEVRERFLKRTKIIQFVRQFLVERDFLEVETPMMQVIPGGALARPFETYHHALGLPLFLRIAPELYLKRLLVGGFERVFELNRNFRNEGIDIDHNPEFTMLEFYQAYATYEDLMSLTEELIPALAEHILGTKRMVYQGNEIDLTPPWTRLGFRQSLKKIGNVPEEVMADPAKTIDYAQKLGTKLRKGEGIGKALAKLFEKLVEPKLIQPTFVVGYPVEVSPLARRNDENPEITDRFELFIAGKEVANGFSELNDPDDQKRRFLAQMSQRDAGDEEAHRIDEDYITALEYGMPPAAGEGIGIDRLVMILTDAACIRDVILFPHLRPEKE